MVVIVSKFTDSILIWVIILYGEMRKVTKRMIVSNINAT